MRWSVRKALAWFGSPPRRSGAPRAAGFTLIELMYSAGFFMVGLAGVVSFQMTSAKGAAQAGAMSLAVNIVSNTIEIARTKTPATLRALPQPVTDYYDRSGTAQGSATGAFYTVVWTAAQPGGTTYFDVTARITWAPDAAISFTHNVQLDTRIPAW